MAIGELRRRLVIEAPVETPDGAGGVARTFSTLATVGAAIEPGEVLLIRWRAHLPAKHAAILVEPDRIVHAHDAPAGGGGDSRSHLRSDLGKAGLSDSNRHSGSDAIA